MFISKRLKIAREKTGMSQERFLVRLSNAGLPLSRQALSSWERGITKPSVDEIVILAKSLHTPLEYFFSKQQHQSGMVCNRE